MASCLVTSCLVASCLVASYPVASDHLVASYLVTSCQVASCLVEHNLVASYLVEHNLVASWAIHKVPDRVGIVVAFLQQMDHHDALQQQLFLRRQLFLLQIRNLPILLLVLVLVTRTS